MFLTLIRRYRPPLEKGLWQDPILGYFETHGKMEFKPGEQYDITDDEKKAVMERYQIKELLKRRYLEMEFNPLRHKYIEGYIMDYEDLCEAGEYLWWDRRCARLFTVSGTGWAGGQRST